MDKKISLPEALIAVMIAFSVDALEVFLWFLGLGPISIIIDIPIMLLFQLWFSMKGGRWQKALLGNAIETLPIPLDALPIRSIFVMWSIHDTNKQEPGKELFL